MPVEKGARASPVTMVEAPGEGGHGGVQGAAAGRGGAPARVMQRKRRTVWKSGRRKPRAWLCFLRRTQALWEESMGKEATVSIFRVPKWLKACMTPTIKILVLERPRAKDGSRDGRRSRCSRCRRPAAGRPFVNVVQGASARSHGLRWQDEGQVRQRSECLNKYSSARTTGRRTLQSRDPAAGTTELRAWISYGPGDRARSPHKHFPAFSRIFPDRACTNRSLAHSNDRLAARSFPPPR